MHNYRAKCYDYNIIVKVVQWCRIKLVCIAGHCFNFSFKIIFMQTPPTVTGSRFLLIFDIHFNQ